MNKSKVLITALLVLVPNLIRCEDRVISYSNENSHFAFNVPGGWEQIDFRFKNSTNEEATKKMKEITRQFDAGFQRISYQQVFDYPYLLIKIHESTGSLDQYKKTVLEQKENLFGEGTPELIIDNKRNFLIVNNTFNLPEQGNVRTSTVFSPGKYKTVQFSFYTDQYERDEDDFNFILNSFKFYPGWEYGDLKEEINNKIIYKIVLIVILILLAIYRANKKKKKAFAP